MFTRLFTSSDIIVYQQNIKDMENNRMPTVTFIYDRKKTATRSRGAVIEIRISYDYKKKYLSTGIKVLPKEWHANMVTGRTDAIELNKALTTMRNNVLKVINDMLEEGCLNIQEIPSRIKRLGSDGKSFYEFCQERADVRKYGKEEDTCKRYDRFLKWFCHWGGIKAFSDVTDRNVLLMDEALKKKGMCNYSKWNNYHRFLNSFINDAISEGYLRRNPYKWVHIEKDKVSHGLHKYLTMEELHSIEAANMGTESLDRVRDLFVFQACTCLSYKDLAAFDMKKVKNEHGRLMYTGKRGKTGIEFTFLLLKPAIAILHKYHGHLPLLSNVKYNQYLKVVAQTAGVDKPITTHWARHTGATMLLNAGVDMETVAKILGHSSTKITRSTYAKLLDDTVAKEMIRAESKLPSASSSL